MNLNQLKIMLLMLCLGLMLAACQVKLSPLQVSEQFWAAIEAKDRNGIRRYVSSSSLTGLELTADILPVTGATFGRTIIEGDQASVDTTVVVLGDKPVTIPLNTFLVREDGRWKVNYDETTASLSKTNELAYVLENLRRLGELFSKQLDRSTDELQRALPKIERAIIELEKHLKTQIPEIRKRFEELARELEDALEPPRRRLPPDEGILI